MSGNARRNVRAVVSRASRRLTPDTCCGRKRPLRRGRDRAHERLLTTWGYAMPAIEPTAGEATGSSASRRKLLERWCGPRYVYLPASAGRAATVRPIRDIQAELQWQEESVVRRILDEFGRRPWSTGGALHLQRSPRHPREKQNVGSENHS